ncbi:MAG TPA: ELWxxDGT repeat protein, partial [Thermoanaerobaculia bacterium]
MRTKSLALAALTLLPALLSAAWAQPAFLVKDIGDAGSASRSPLWWLPSLRGGPAELDGALYFPSDDGIHGVELWRSDGTAAGTRLVRDLCPGICASSLGSLAAFQHRIYWLSDQLWTSDGTPQGTAPFLNPESPAAASRLIPMGEAGGRLLLSGTTGQSSQGELWATDGTPAGTVRLRKFPAGPGSYSLRPALIG